MILKTDRLILRPPVAEDAKEYLTFRNSDFVLRYNAMGKQTLEKAIAELTSRIPGERNVILEHTATSQVIGIVCIREDSLRWGVGSKEISYFLSEQYARKGYMEEALTAVIHHLFEEDILCITARSFAPNTASNALLKSLGFQKEGILRRCVKGYEDIIYDDVVYSLLKDEWKE